MSFFTQNNGKGGLGSAIWGFEKNTWRWWFDNVEYANLSPDSTQITYVYSDVLHVVDANGQNATAIRGSLDDILDPRWSGDGTKISYIGYEGSARTLRVLNKDGTGRQILGDYTGHTWAPQGTVLAYKPWKDLDVLESSPARIFKIRRDAVVSHNLESSEIVGLFDETDEQIFTPHPGGGITQVVDNQKRIHSFIWTPDGNHLLAVLGEYRSVTNPIPDVAPLPRNSVYFALIPTDGGQLQRLTEDILEISGVELNQAKATNLLLLDWSPNKQKLMYVFSDPFANQPIQHFTLTLSGIVEEMPNTPNDRLLFQWGVLNPNYIEAALEPVPHTLAIGDTSTLTLTVTNNRETPITAVQLVENGLRQVSGEGEVVLTGGPTPGEPFSIEPGESDDILFEVTATKNGTVILEAEISALDEDSNPLSETTRAPRMTIQSRGDLLIKKKEDPEAMFGENDVYQSGPVGAQVENSPIKPNETAEYQIRIENDNDEATSFVVRAREEETSPTLDDNVLNQNPGGDRWTRTYAINGEDQTTALFSEAGYDTGDLGPGASLILEVGITADTQESGASFSSFITLFEDAEAEEALDAVEANTSILNIIIVNDDRDLPDFDPEDGVLDADPDMEGNQVTLRAAVDFANEREGTDEINFDIGGGGTPKIVLENREFVPGGTGGSYLDGGIEITETVIIDGTTQPGSGMVEITRTTEEFSASWDGDSLIDLNHHDSVLRGLVINGNAGFGVRLGGQGQHVIEGCYIGTDVTGTRALGNGIVSGSPGEDIGGGILIASPFNRIGGSSAGQGNLISGNGPLGGNGNEDYTSFTPGIMITGAQSIQNLVIGNTVGLDVTGENILGRTSSPNLIYSQFPDILITQGSNGNGPSNNQIGGVLPGEGNFIGAVSIAGNTRHNRIRGNFIGTNRSGTQVLDQAQAGVTVIDAFDTEIGDLSDNSGNLIPRGMVLNNTEGTRIVNNLIGVAADGVTPLRAGEIGISVVASTNTEIVANTIANKGYSGLHFESGSENSLIFQNRFVDNIFSIDGGLPGSAISLLEGKGHKISLNTFTGNGIPIDLAPLNLNRNDPGDSDDGANGLINYPEIQSATINNDAVDVRVKLDLGQISETVTLEFFASMQYSPYTGATIAQAESVVSQFEILPLPDSEFLISLEDGDGAGLDQFRLPRPGEYLTATTTSPTLGTSEMSFGVLVQGATQTDSDGISDEVEDLVPNREPPTEPLLLGRSTDISTTLIQNQAEGFGDGNGDGTLDSQQNHVASFPSLSGDFVTIQLNTNGAQLEAVSPKELPTAQNLPRFEFPAWLIEFRINAVTDGSAVVDLFLLQPTGTNSFWIYGASIDNPEAHWQEFLFDGTLGAEFLEDRIRLHLADGQTGDTDLQVNGSISVLAAPGIALPLPQPSVKLISQNPNTTKVHWPINTGSVVVEESKDLENWNPLVAQIEVIDGKDAITTQPASIPVFYRLSREE
ncbi:MAG: hypothetical protein KJT03_02860 [Verrucomicrobiae bacterium]|nr:hypothetical protein [Verrucomicrobiae bacterium]